MTEERTARRARALRGALGAVALLLAAQALLAGAAPPAPSARSPLSQARRLVWGPTRPPAVDAHEGSTAIASRVLPGTFDDAYLRSLAARPLDAPRALTPGGALAWAVPVAAALAGLVALWPLRRGLGAWGHALGALPAGYVGLTLSACLASALAAPFSVTTASAGLAAFTAAASAGAAGLARRRPLPAAGGTTSLPANALTAAGALAAAGASSAGFAALGRAFVTPDSFFDGASGVRLIGTGALDGGLMSTRHPMMPVVHAAERLLGADPAFVSFPMFALVTAALLATALARSLPAMPSRRRLAAVTAVTGLAVVTPVFLFDAFYIHSHMASAMFLLLSVAGVVLGSPAEDRRPDVAWLALGGIGAAGLVLARPDGIAYAFVPSVALLTLLAEDTPPFSGAAAREAAASFFAPLLVTAWSAYGLVLLRTGVWAAEPTARSSKAGGAAVLALLAALTLLALVPAAAGRAPSAASRADAFARRIGRGRLPTAAAAVVLLVAAVRPARFATAVYHMAANLFVAGGWGVTWLAALILAGVALTWRRTRPATGADDASDPRMHARPVGTAVWLFFACALTVHGAGHPGRIGWSDSFTRVAFHVLPLLFWYAALLSEELRAAAAGVGAEAEGALAVREEAAPSSAA